MYLVEAAPELSLRAVAERAKSLAPHARPCFVRLVESLPRTDSFKVKKARFAEEGVDPAGIVDPLYYRSGDEYLPLGAAEYAQPRYAGSFRHRAVFAGGNVRTAIREGRADWVPVFLSEIPGLITSEILPVDVAFIHVSPPDEHGFCSYGVGVECSKAAAEKAKTVVALVNRQMPRALGDAFIHVSRLTHVVEIDRPVVEIPQQEQNRVRPIRARLEEVLAVTEESLGQERERRGLARGPQVVPGAGKAFVHEDGDG